MLVEPACIAASIIGIFVSPLYHFSYAQAHCGYAAPAGDFFRRAGKRR